MLTSLRADIAETLEALAATEPWEEYSRWDRLTHGARTLRWCDRRDEEALSGDEIRGYESKIDELEARQADIRNLVEEFRAKRLTPARFRDAILAVVG